MEDHMRVTLAAADSIGLVTDQCDNFRRIIGLGVEEKIKEQLEAVRIFVRMLDGVARWCHHVNTAFAFLCHDILDI